jgi:hypothetical protein
MKIQNGALALTGSACPEKAIELFYVTHPKVAKPLLGPFLNAADAECGRVVMRSADAVVTCCPVDSIDEATYWHALNHGRIVQMFAGADRPGVNHG